MTISTFIRQNMEAVLADWEAFARTLTPAADSMDIEALRDHAEEMLLAIADDLECPQTAAEQEAKSHGLAADHATREHTAAGLHGRIRAERGFTLVQMISEYRALRASVQRLYTRTAPADAHANPDDVTRFHEAIDQAVAESVLTFSRELDRSRELFIGIVGHDLRNPLGAILRAAGNLLDSEEPSSPAFRAASGILDSARRMRIIVADLLDLTRIRLGAGSGIPISPSDTDLARVARQVMDETSAAHPGRDLRLDTRGNARGRWDGARVGQALVNLLVNALRHGDPDTPITVTLNAGDDHVVLGVHNRGPAVPEHIRRGRFEPLQRSDTHAPSAGESGLGLGLYITQEIAAAHGGDLTVESSQAEGTTFSIRLPRLPQPT